MAPVVIRLKSYFCLGIKELLEKILDELQCSKYILLVFDREHFLK